VLIGTVDLLRQLLGHLAAAVWPHRVALDLPANYPVRDSHDQDVLVRLLRRVIEGNVGHHDALLPPFDGVSDVETQGITRDNRGQLPFI